MILKRFNANLPWVHYSRVVEANLGPLAKSGASGSTWSRPPSPDSARLIRECCVRPVSVIITCYNLAHYITEAIESVLAQQYSGEIEIIVIDDCSTDGSAEVIRGFANVRSMRLERNNGVLLAMLAGVNQASHDICCLLDGDDIWEPGKVQEVSTAFAANSKVCLVTHDLKFVDAAGQPLARHSRSREVLQPLNEASRKRRVRKGILELDDYVWLGSALSFRRSLARWEEFDAFANSLPDPRNCYQDWPLAYWIAALPDSRMAYVGQPLLRYRIHGQNHSGDARTTERAARNFMRTRNTYAAIATIADIRLLPNEFKRLASERSRLAGAQADLYAGRKLLAISGFIRSLPLARRLKMVFKEAVRFGIGLVLGPAALVKLAGWAR